MELRMRDGSCLNKIGGTPRQDSTWREKIDIDNNLADKIYDLAKIYEEHYNIYDQRCTVKEFSTR